VTCSRVIFTFTFSFIGNKNWENTLQRYCTTGPSFSFVFAFHCDYHKSIPSMRHCCQSRLRCLRVLQTTELHIFEVTATLNASTRKVSRSSAQSRQISGSRSPRRMNFVPWRLISVDPQYAACFLSPLWLQELCGVTQIYGKFVLPCFRLLSPQKVTCCVCRPPPSTISNST